MSPRPAKNSDTLSVSAALEPLANSGDGLPNAAHIATCADASRSLDDNAASDDAAVSSKMTSAPGRNSYPGGKNGAGVYQAIINLMPPHETYVEAFLGSGAVIRNKRSALRNIVIERDEDVLRAFKEDAYPNFHRMLGDALTILQGWRFCLPMPTDKEAMKRTLIYLDPPYLMSTRSSKGAIYRHELSSEEEHLRLLEILLNLPCMVMLSGYRSELYDRVIGHWRRAEFQTTNRAGKRTLESVWMNFPEPLELHDYRFLGNGFRERERIKRRRARWRARFLRMPAQERHALMATIEELRGEFQ
jgi:DNA adenine methylase